MPDLIEKLAAIEHRQWAHWTRYLLTFLGHFPNSPDPNVRRWWKQIETPYKNLSEKEKEADRVWARKVLEILRRE